MKNTSKAITLIELLVAVSLLSIVAMAAFSLDGMSRKFLGSSQRLAVVEADLMTAMAHIQKYASQATGIKGVNCTHSEEPSAGCYPTSDNSTAYDSKMVDFRIENQTNPTPGDFSDDIPIGYTISVFDTYTDHKIVFARGWPSTFEFISTRVTSDGTSFIVDPVANCLHVTLSGLYNHDLPEDSRTNPRVTINSTIFFTQVSAN